MTISLERVERCPVCHATLRKKMSPTATPDPNLNDLEARFDHIECDNGHRLDNIPQSVTVVTDPGNDPKGKK